MAIDEACGHLLALRSVLGAAIVNVDAALAALDSSEEEIEMSEPSNCKHPKEQRMDLTPAGSSEERWYCKACGTKGGAW